MNNSPNHILPAADIKSSVGSDVALPALGKGERRLLSRAEERLSQVGLSEFRDTTLRLSERGRDRALNILVEQNTAIVANALSSLRLTDEQIGSASGYASFMRELGFVGHAKRIEMLVPTPSNMRHIVFQEREGGPFEVRMVSKALTATQIERQLGLHVNWYGADARTPKEAIEKALAGGYKFRDARSMDALRMRALSLGEQVGAHVRDNK